MKDHDWYEMKDPTDIYLSRCIKNWVNQYQPPEDGREQLLQAAMSYPLQRTKRVSPFVIFTTRVIYFLEEILLGQTMVDPKFGWVIGPSSHSRAWFVHLTTNWRLVY